MNSVAVLRSQTREADASLVPQFVLPIDFTCSLEAKSEQIPSRKRNSKSPALKQLKVDSVVSASFGKVRGAASKISKLCDSKLLSAEQHTLSLEERQSLAEQNRESARKLALSMITRWKCRIEADELQSVIDLALCEAAMRYDRSHGAGFMTFLYYHLKGKLIKTITARAEDNLDFIGDYERPRAMMDSDSECGIRSKEWKNLSFSDAEYVALDDLLHRQQLYDRCHQACQRLKGVEKEVIRQIFFENKELSQVTSEMGYSRGHLFRVRMKALEKIRRAVGAHPV